MKRLKEGGLQADRCGWRVGVGGPVCPLEGDLWHNDRGFSMATHLTASSSLVLVGDDNTVSRGSWINGELWADPPVGYSCSQTQQQLGLCWDSYVRTDRRTARLSPASKPSRPLPYGNKAKTQILTMEQCFLVFWWKKSVSISRNMFDG